MKTLADTYETTRKNVRRRLARKIKEVKRTSRESRDKLRDIQTEFRFAEYVSYINGILDVALEVGFVSEFEKEGIQDRLFLLEPQYPISW